MQSPKIHTWYDRTAKDTKWPVASSSKNENVVRPASHQLSIDYCPFTMQHTASWHGKNGITDIVRGRGDLCRRRQLFLTAAINNKSPAQSLHGGKPRICCFYFIKAEVQQENQMRTQSPSMIVDPLLSFKDYNNSNQCRRSWITHYLVYSLLEWSYVGQGPSLLSLWGFLKAWPCVWTDLLTQW